MQLIETEVSISPCHWSLTKLEGNPVDLIEDIFEATNMLNKYFACLHIASLIKPWLPSNIIQTYRAPKTRFTVQKKDYSSEKVSISSLWNNSKVNGVNHS